MSEFVFYPLAALSVLAALGVVFAANPVRSAMSLVATLILLAVFFVALQAHLVAALQIIVYAGAVMVLFLFVIMLLDLRGDSGEGGRFGAKLIALFAAATMAALFGKVSWEAAAGPSPSLDEAFGTTTNVARSLFTDHLVSFELTSILLLVAIVGAVVLARRSDSTSGDF